MIANRDDWSPEKMGLVFMATVSVVFFVVISVRIQLSDRHFIPITIFALFSGLIYEGKRIYGKWQSLRKAMITASFIGLLAFFPGSENQSASVYSFEDRIVFYPYAFILAFIGLTVMNHREKATPTLTEGDTLLLSVASIYWISDIYQFKFSATEMVLATLLLIFCCYSIFHALTDSYLCETSKIRLSVGSSIITFMFCLDNTWHIFRDNLEIHETTLASIFTLLFQYFLLGVSSIYMAQNAMMLFRFFPDRDHFFNSVYFSRIRRLKKEHIERYSSVQIRISFAVSCIFFAGTLFGLNSYFHIVPRNMSIWTVFVLFPLLYGLGNRKSLKSE
jgi:hypothetical protein